MSFSFSSVSAKLSRTAGSVRGQHHNDQQHHNKGHKHEVNLETMSTPNKSAPNKSAPAKPVPAKLEPAKSTPAKSTPAKSTPTKSTPIKSTPTESPPPPKLIMPSLATNSPGTWRHPRLNEITRRRDATTFTEKNVRRIAYNVVTLLVFWSLQLLVKGYIINDINLDL